MITLEEARALLLEGVSPLPPTIVPIGDSGGRVLASDILAARDQPPTALSAMDGYAVRARDAVAGASLQVIGEAPAGSLFQGSVNAGQAVRIATGAALPDGADAIVVQENVSRQDDFILVDAAPASGEYVRSAGMDFRAGALIASAGERLTPARHALIAAANIGAVSIHERPTIAIFPTGDELREPGTPLTGGQIADSASYAIADLVEQWGGLPRRHAIVPDEREVARNCLEDALSADVIVTIGGASVGDRDLLRPLVRELGGEFLFEKIAIQPGKPSWHARMPGGALVLGLPGNPVSAYVCAHLLLKPLLLRLSGQAATPELHTVSAKLTNDLPVSGAREIFVRARLSLDKHGALLVTAEPRLDSSLLSALAAANALIRRKALSPAATSGDPVAVLTLGNWDLGTSE